MISVAFVAVAVYVPVKAQRVVPPDAKMGVPTEGVVVTVCVVVVGPLHPAALAVITEVPLQPAT